MVMIEVQLVDKAFICGCDSQVNPKEGFCSAIMKL